MQSPWQAPAEYNKTALSCRLGSNWVDVSQGELRRRSSALTARLHHAGIDHGGRVVILGESGPGWVVALLAALDAGATVIPVDVKLSPSERSALIADARPNVLFVSERWQREAASLQAEMPGLQDVISLEATTEASGASAMSAPGPEAAAFVVYTSGTTDRPKGVEITRAGLRFQVEGLARAMRLVPQDAFLSMLPLSNLLEIVGGHLCPLHVGAAVHYAPSLDPATVAGTIRERGISYALTTPLFLRLLASEVEKGLGLAPGFKGFIVGGAPLDPVLESILEARGISLFQGYGLTEATTVVTLNTPSARRRASVGRPLSGVAVRIADPDVSGEGEILTRGPHVMAGYVHRDDLTGSAIDPEGWLHTGDRGHIDEDGYLYVTGRTKTLIVLSSGKKVQPEEVEEALVRGGIGELCVIGCRVRAGVLAGAEEVCAVIVPKGGGANTSSAKHLLEEEVRRRLPELCRDLSPYKWPTRIVVRDEPLPRLSTLKVQRSALAGWLERLEEGS
jgi:long-chain acyl-CoA synthetase